MKLLLPFLFSLFSNCILLFRKQKKSKKSSDKNAEQLKTTVPYSKLFWLKLLHRRRNIRGVSSGGDTHDLKILDKDSSHNHSSHSAGDSSHSQPGNSATNSLLRKLNISENRCISKVTVIFYFIQFKIVQLCYIVG